MVSKGFIAALAVIGALSLGSPASVIAAEPWVEVRQTLLDECDQYQGRMGSHCRRAASGRMHTYYEESRSLYRDCLAAGNSRAVCDEEREEYWRNKLVF